MAKDPAFLFYSSDFLTGVSDLDYTEIGVYITLLCLQHQKGRLSKKVVDMKCRGIDAADLLDKFTIDENGFYYNERLEIEANKRREHSEKQSQRAKDGWKKRKSNIDATADATALPLVNENEVIINNTIYKKNIISDKAYLEITAMQTKSNVDTVLKYLQTFEKHLIQTSEQKQTLKDFKSHFTNWFNRQEIKKVIKHVKQRYV